MPCYLFTYHAYSSWMPDREEGYVRRGEGLLPADEERARLYRRDAVEQPVVFDPRIQLLLIDEVRAASPHQRFRVHYVATEPTHVHALVSWQDDRPWKNMRSNLKSSLTRRLNRELERRTWLSENASRKQVKHQAHFDYLVNEYLPSHRGRKWKEGSEPIR